ncbi:hypothetical protein [Sphingomonas phyllosphaerae]|uniref:hypothetical protein n=1 Tax=Sphingomonas phyllosphaerae TaxID=257003 RepID=UPI002413054D|nr:hypothetical protein [Sphingomonas phyllosphaerae]
MMIGYAILGVPIVTLFVLLAFFIKREPMSPQYLIGCYTATSGPTLNIRYKTMSYGKGRSHLLSYVVETSKDGYHLLVSPAMILRRGSDGNFAFSSGRGVGYFWNLLAKDGSQRLRAPSDYDGQFYTTATDGSSVVYSRTNDRTECGS